MGVIQGGRHHSIIRGICKNMREKIIENRLKNEVEKKSGKAWKLTSPGVVGVPDRLVILPGGRVIFVELKAPGKSCRPIQEFRIKELSDLGCEVLIIDSIEKVVNFINEI